MTSLGGAHGVAISTDGAHLYATASVDDAVVVFARDMGANPLTFGRLTQIQVQPNLRRLGRALGIAAFMFAEIISVGGLYLDLEWGYVFAFCFFIAMMFARPQGILARRS